MLYHTRFGLRLRACGEHPQAADSVGINVYKMRYSGVMISGFLGGVGGMAYVLAAGSSFEGDVGGYGFLAIAVMIFGNWKPFRILFSAFFFALFRILGTSFTLLPFLPKFSSLGRPSNVYNLLPYIVTIIVLVFTSKSSHAPKAEGIPPTIRGNAKSTLCAGVFPGAHFWHDPGEADEQGRPDRTDRPRRTSKSFGARRGLLPFGGSAAIPLFRNGIGAQPAKKNPAKSVRHSSSRTPPVTSGW